MVGVNNVEVRDNINNIDDEEDTTMMRSLDLGSHIWKIIRVTMILRRMTWIVSLKERRMLSWRALLQMIMIDEHRDLLRKLVSGVPIDESEETKFLEDGNKYVSWSRKGRRKHENKEKTQITYEITWATIRKAREFF